MNPTFSTGGMIYQRPRRKSNDMLKRHYSNLISSSFTFVFFSRRTVNPGPSPQLLDLSQWSLFKDGFLGMSFSEL